MSFKKNDFFFNKEDIIDEYVYDSLIYFFTLVFAFFSATYGVGSGSGLATEAVMNFAKSCGAFTHSNAEVRDSAKVCSYA